MALNLAVIRIRNRCAFSAAWFRGLMFGLLVGFVVSPAVAQLNSVARYQMLNTQSLSEIEHNVLPEAIVEGPNQYSSIADYYVGENRELTFRLEHAREVYDQRIPRPLRMVTLIAGDAGIGKTFLKQKILSENYPAEEVCRFDIRDLYEKGKSGNYIVEKPDLFSRDVVLCSLPAMRDPNWQGLYEYMSKNQASFYVIDSLDEVHPDDYVSLLEQVDRFAFEPHREFVHVVVLGRGIAFRDYWEKKSGHFSTAELNLYMLEPPNILTTGDWLVSSWNYHQFAHQLRWKNSSAEFSFSDYQQWSAQNFERNGRFVDVATTPCDAIDPQREAALFRLVCEHRFLQKPVRNLAGNGFLREIVDHWQREEIPFDESAFKREYFHRWLVRDTKSGKRPSATRPEHLELYLRLLEEVAAKVLREDRVDESGFFSLHDDDPIECNYKGDQLSFPAHRILNRSGLKHLDPRTPGDRRYRFEPVWLHRMLVDSYNRRISSTTTSACGQ